MIIVLLSLMMELRASPILDPMEKNSAVLINPTVPAISAMTMGLVSLTEVDKYLKLQALDINLRGYYVLNPRIGLMAQLDASKASFLFSASNVGLRLGPRISLYEQGLSDWMFTPFVMGGMTRISSGEYTFSRWGNIGIGGEVGRTWVWDSLVFEMGAGLYSTMNIGYERIAEGFAHSAPPEPILPVKPSWNIGIGYAF